MVKIGVWWTTGWCTTGVRIGAECTTGTWWATTGTLCATGTIVFTIGWLWWTTWLDEWLTATGAAWTIGACTIGVAI